MKGREAPTQYRKETRLAHASGVISVAPDAPAQNLVSLIDTLNSITLSDEDIAHNRNSISDNNGGRILF